MGDAVDDIGVAFKTDVADVGVAGQNVALRLIQLVQRLFGVQDLRLAVLQIPNGKVVIATPGAENLALLLKLCLGAVQFPLRLIQSLLRFRPFFLIFGCSGGKFFFRIPELSFRVVKRGPVLRKQPGRLPERGFLLAELFLILLQYGPCGGLTGSLKRLPSDELPQRIRGCVIRSLPARKLLARRLEGRRVRRDLETKRGEVRGRDLERRRSICVCLLGRLVFCLRAGVFCIELRFGSFQL